MVFILGVGEVKGQGEDAFFDGKWLFAQEITQFQKRTLLARQDEAIFGEKGFVGFEGWREGFEAITLACLGKLLIDFGKYKAQVFGKRDGESCQIVEIDRFAHGGGVACASQNLKLQRADTHVEKVILVAAANADRCINEPLL